MRVAAPSTTPQYRTVPPSTKPQAYALMRVRPLRLVGLACRRSQSISSGCGLNCATASPGVCCRIQQTPPWRGMQHGEAACTRLLPGCARALSNGQLQATAGFHAGCGYRAVGDTMPTGIPCRRRALSKGLLHALPLTTDSPHSDGPAYGLKNAPFAPSSPAEVRPHSSPLRPLPRLPPLFRPSPAPLSPLFRRSPGSHRSYAIFSRLRFMLHAGRHETCCTV